MNDPTRQDLESLWRSRLHDSKLYLDLARSYTTEVQREFPPDDGSPDGHFAHRRALRAETSALAQYNRVLRIFTDLVIDGTIPEESEWPWKAGGPE